MLTHDPEKRPSANVLLESNIIPFEQEEQFEQLLDRMINSTNGGLQSFYYRKTIEKLFQRKNHIARDATYDPDTSLDFNKVSLAHSSFSQYSFLFSSWPYFIAIHISMPVYEVHSFVYVRNTEHSICDYRYSFLKHRSIAKMNVRI